MDEEIDAIFNSGIKPQAGSGGQQQTSSPVSDLDQIFKPQQGAAPANDLDEIFRPQQAAPQQIPLQEEMVAPPGQLPVERPGYIEAFNNALKRGIGQVEQMAPAARGMLAEAQGDEEGKAQALSEIQAIEAEAPTPVVGSIADINNFDDFTYWLTEKFGEQAPILGTMAVTGGVGALAGNLVGRGMLMNAASRAALMKRVGTASGYAGAAGLESAGMATELAQATGDFRPELAIPGGLAAGALEIYTPLKFLKELPVEGILKTGLRTAGREAATEMGQEQIAILARDYADPNYTYFSKNMVMRTLESGAAGLVVGGGVGTVGKAITTGLGINGEPTDERHTLTPEEIAAMPAPPVEPSPTQKEVPDEPQESPVSWLRRKMMGANRGSPDMIPNDPSATEDIIEQAPLLKGIKKKWSKAGAQERQMRDIANLVDDTTDRYVIMDSGGNTGNRVLTSTGLEEALAMRETEEFMPRIVKIDQQSMQPGAITAELFDLPDSSSSRLYFAGKRMFFLPGVRPQEQAELKARYDVLVDKINSKPWQLEVLDESRIEQLAQLQAEYEALVNKGLRVIPTPGANFHYNGVVDGEQVREIPKSGRSFKIAKLNDDGIFGEFYDPAEVVEIGPNPGGDSKYIAVDFNKVPEDHFDRVETIAGGRPAFFKLKPGKTIPKSAIVRGINRPGINDRESGPHMKAYMRDYDAITIETDGRIYTNIDDTRVSKEVRDTVNQLSRALHDLKPVLAGLYKRLGIKNPPNIFIHYDGLSSFASPALNEIGLSAQAFMSDQWHYLHASPDLRTALLVTLFHELGHLVTLRSWGKLPAAVMEQAHIGYQRALLKFRISGATEHLGLPIGTFTSTDRQVDYNLTFIEYLAETFRRWAFSDARIMTDLDKYYQEGGKLLQKLKEEAVNTVGTAKAEDLYRANFSFNQVMEYLESAAEMGLRPVQMMAKAFQGGEYPHPIELAKARMAIEGELARFRQLLTADMNVEISSEVDVQDTDRGSVIARFGTMAQDTRTLRILAGTLALMGDKSQVSKVIVHEAFHGVQDMLTVAEAKVLVEAAKRAKVLSPSELAHYVKDVNKWLADNNITDPAQIRAAMDYTIETELMAALVESRANGAQYESIVSKILDHILQTVERIVNALRGLGYNSSEDVIRMYYRGELTRRYDLAQMQERRNYILDALGAFDPTQSFEEKYPGLVEGTQTFAPNNQNEATKYEQVAADETAKKKRKGYLKETRIVRPVQDPKQSSIGEIPTRPMLAGAEQLQLDPTTTVEFVESKDQTGKVKLSTYVAKAPDGSTKAWAEVSHEEGRGYAVDNVYVNRKYYREGLPMKIYKLVEERMGETPKPNGFLTKAGYRALLKINPMLVQDYVFDSTLDAWLSPYQLQKTINMHVAMYARDKRLGRTELSSDLAEQIIRLKELQKTLKVPKTAAAQYMTREFNVKTVEQVNEQNEKELVDAVTGSETARPDPFDQLQEQQEQREIKRAAKLLGLPENMVAPSQADNHLMNGIIDKMRRTPEKDPATNRYLSGVSAEMDRISWFSKIFFGLHQLVWRNEHLFQTKNYLALVEQMNSRIMSWVSRADDVGKAWDALPERQRNLLSEYMFWLTEMEYLTPAERAANVVRHPTAQERAQYITQNRLSQNTVQVGQRVEQEFTDYLNEVERVSKEHAQRTIQDPQALQIELNRISAEMNLMRAKPYFPMTRFGEFTISVRDPQQNGRVVAFYAYPTVREMKAAVRQIHGQWPLMELQTGKVPEEAQEFMGLPAALLRIIKANLKLNSAQARWLEEFELLMAPERSFRKRWLSRKGTPGYSLDGIRVFAQYFRSGARYLGRIEYKDLMQEQINSLQGTVKTLRDGTRRAMIVDYMQRHLNYLMEGGRDWGKLKSMISIFQLGGSVAAAGMNLTQVPLATYPYLAGLFGDLQTLKALKRNADVLRPTFGIPAKGSIDYLAAREEAVAQGKIEAGQAIDLGAFAEYDNLNRSYAGTAAQRAWRKVGYWSMILFSRSEQFNREWSFKSAYELALANKNSKHFQDTAATYASEILEVSARRGLTPDQATAFMVARRAVDQTQLVFQPWARPTFLRSGFASTLQIFFSYTQGMLYLLGNSPGAKRMWFGLLAMYGLAGLPGSEDLDRIIRLLARKFMGKDFSPQLEARKMIREMTRGTVFDQVGPDLAMHGISRYSMVGIGLLPEGYGVPRFDASASGSMGQIVPGLSEALRAAANNANWKDMTADIARDVAGAGFGQIFALMQFATSDPFSADLKKWEKVFPRSVKAASKAYRYATEGREVTNQGGTLAKFDMRDPDDIATVVAQAFGFTPEKVSEKWSMIRATQDIALWYETRKMALYAQLDVAVRNGESEDQKAVIERMVSLNKELAKQGWGAMSIQVAPVVNSLRQRARVRALQDNNLPAKTSQIPLTKQMLDLYPGMMQEISREKVK